MSVGSLLPKLIVFTIPVILSGVLQLLFNAADLVVVGRFAGDAALGQVGATSALINLIVNLLIGLSIGANVTVARHFGAKNARALSATVHTTVLVALVGGIIIGLVGFACAYPLLSLMGTPDDLIDGAALYMRIIFVGVPVTALYNYGAAILRAIGDTKRPLYYLIAAGVLNVILNLIFVIVFKMTVDGVALATVLSQCLSMALIIRCLMKSEGDYRLELKKLRFHRSELWQIVKIGIPAGLQGCVFSISNVIIQSSINSFGSAAISGNTAAASIDGFMFCSLDAFNQTATSAISQNIGARKYDRVDSTVKICSLIVAVLGTVLAAAVMIFRYPLVNIYATEKDVLEFGAYRLIITCPVYFTCGLMGMMGGVNRGLGYSLLPTVVSLIGACLFRIVWIYTIFAANHTPFMLFVSYPISWVLTSIAHYVCYFLIRKRAFARNEALYQQ